MTPVQKLFVRCRPFASATPGGPDQYRLQAFLEGLNKMVAESDLLPEKPRNGQCREWGAEIIKGFPSPVTLEPALVGPDWEP